MATSMGLVPAALFGCGDIDIMVHHADSSVHVSMGRNHEVGDF